jgi:hypothetical protein
MLLQVQETVYLHSEHEIGRIPVGASLPITFPSTQAVCRFSRRTGGPPVSNDVSRLLSVKRTQASRLSYDAFE